MSSTNRGNARDFHAFDYYVTPQEDIELFLNNFNKDEIINWKYCNILDSAAGGNLKTSNMIHHQMSYPTVLTKLYNCKNLHTIDIRADSLAELKTNYLVYDLPYQPDVIITNPPFKYALEFIEKGLSDLKDGGFLIVLVRLNFFGSKARFPFFNNHMPKYCYVHHTRMSFTDKINSKTGEVIINPKTNKPVKGNTDSIEYCHLVFQKGYKNNYTMLKVI